MRIVLALLLVAACHSPREPVQPKAAPIAERPVHRPGRADVDAAPSTPLAELVVTRPCGPAPVAEPRPLPDGRMLFVGKQIDPCAQRPWVPVDPLPAQPRSPRAGARDRE